MNNLSIGILELGHRGKTNALTAAEQVLTYAVKADELGFSRFWLAEHHNPNPPASYTNPEILISIIAGMTDTIRVGSAGTLVKLYNPYHTATNFKLLNNLFSNRIDLGLSKGNPGTRYTRNQLFDLQDKRLFEKNIKEIYHLFHDEEHRFETDEIVMPPFGGQLPEMWYLSNSYRKFNDAIEYQLNYCRSVVHGQGLVGKDYNKEELIHNKSLFFDKNGYDPKVSLAVGVSMDTTIEKAKKKYEDRLRDQAVHPSEAWNFIPVTSSSLGETLREYQYLYGIDEFILLDMEHDNEKRIENMEAIHDTFNLNEQPVSEVEEGI